MIEVVNRRRTKLARRASVYDPAAYQDERPLTEREATLQVMRREKRREPSRGAIFDESAQQRVRVVVQTRIRLVEQ